jgi:hypothetical protein
MSKAPSPTKKRAKGKADEPLLFAEPEPVDPETLAAIHRLAADLAHAIATLPLAHKVDALNHARLALHEVSPFVAEPVDCVLWIRCDRVDENSWNPNEVIGPALSSLVHSVEKFGYTMSAVGAWIGGGVDAPGALARAKVVDGAHRKRLPKMSPVIFARTHGYIPLSFLPRTMTEADLQSATVLHNKAKGEHDVEREVKIVVALDKAGWSSEAVGQGTVKTNEELVRMRQLGGAAENLASASYGKAWTF